MNTIILDVDGVISLDGSSFDVGCMSQLRRIVEATQAEVVLSTSRRKPKALHDIFHVCEDFLIPLAGITRDLPLSDDPVSDRLDEVVEWVRRHKLTRWVTIDDIDLDSMIQPRHNITREELSRHFVHCTDWQGITGDVATAAINKLMCE